MTRHISFLNFHIADCFDSILISAGITVPTRYLSYFKEPHPLLIGSSFGNARIVARNNHPLYLHIGLRGCTQPSRT
jgi:hypothetical protein